MPFNVFKKRLRIGSLAFSVESIGVGIDSDAASFISLAGGVALTGADKAKGTMGLRFRWRDGEFLGVAFEKATLLIDSDGLNGELLVQYVDEMVPADGKFEHRQGWRGRGELLMKVLPHIFVHVEAAFGTEPVRHTYFFVEVGSTSQGFPVGPIAFYGISGLFGENFVPDKRPDQLWYEDWFRDKQPRFSAVAVEKWRVEPDGRAFGLGTTIGTSGDKGKKFSAKLIFVLSLPGPVFILAGYGNFLTDIKELQHPERALLNLLFIYDNNARTISGNVGLQYQHPRPGTKEAEKYGAGFLLDTYGLLDVFFDLARSSNWHIYIGERPKEKRIRAELIKFMRVDAYLMIDPSMVELGASVGWDWRRKWGPLRVELAAWIEGVLGLVYEPTQVFGALRVGGHARLRAYGFGAGITLGADLSGGSPHPWFYHLELVFRLELPWFLPDIKVRAEFGDRNDAVPPVPLALRSMALTNDLPIADTPVTLFPNLDPDGDGLLIDPVDTSYDEAAAADQAPLIPLDAKPAIGFGHPFNDRINLVSNPPDAEYTEAYGEEGFFRYDLTHIQLWKRPRRSKVPWTLVDERLPGTAQNSIDWSDYQGDLHIFGHTRLYGEMLFDDSQGENLPVGLRLWAKTPFNIHLAGDDEAEQTLEENPGYPCIPITEKPPQECADYSRLILGQPLGESHRLGKVYLHSPHGGRVVGSSDLKVGEYALNASGERLRLIFPEREHSMSVRLIGRQPISWVVGREGVVIFQKDNDFTELVQYSDDQGIDWVELFLPLPPAQPTLMAIIVQTPVLRVREVCFASLKGWQNLLLALEAAAQIQAAYPPGFDVQAETLLEPDQEYKLTLQTEVLYSEDGIEFQTRETFIQHTYFKTAGPPGLFPTSTALKDLTPYVNHTAPGNGDIPVYRGYDIRIGFRDDAAVRGMYARSLETLRLVISDGTEGLSQSLDGRPELVDEDWLRDNRIQFNYQLVLWHKLVTASPCLEPADYGGGDVLTGTPIELLKADRRYEASLVLASSPYLRRSLFQLGDLGAMTRVDSGNVSAPGQWEIVDGVLVQRSAISGPAPAGVLTGLGSALILGDPNWRNYQVQANITAEMGRVGLLAGYQNPSNFYLATVDAVSAQVELIRVQDGVWTSLAVRQPTNPAPGPTRALTFIYTGEWLQVTLDEELLEPVFDDSFPRGRTGMFTSGATGAQFTDFLVSGVPLYRFGFTTSRYANFQAHVASFPGVPAYRQIAIQWSDLANNVGNTLTAFPSNSDSSSAADQMRNKEFDSLLNLLSLPAGEPPENVDITLLECQDGPLAWLIESPEPLRWRDRTSLNIARQKPHIEPWWLDDDTIRLHQDSWQLAQSQLPRMGRKPKDGLLTPDVKDANRVARHSLLELLAARDGSGLKLLGLKEDPSGRAYLEFLATKTTQVSNLRLQWSDAPDGMRGVTGKREYRDLFTFPQGTHIKDGQRLRIYEGEPLNALKINSSLLTFSTQSPFPDALAEQGSLLRLADWRGFIKAIFPILPYHYWEVVDPSRLRLVFTADSRKALLFMVDDIGVPQIWARGQYRFTFTFLRDLGSPESTWSDHGSTAPESATFYLRVAD